MKKYFFGRIQYLMIAVIMLLSLNAPIAFAGTDGKTITILFTSDMHDHFLPENIEQNGQVVESGGYSRLQSAINEERQKNPDLLLVDGGDFSMGTPFQTLYKTDAPELRIMGQMGYDAVTLGNHEFDYRAEGLTATFNTAKNSGDKLPQIVQSNTTFPTDKDGNFTESLSALKQAENNYGVKDYTIIERSGIKIGIFGLMGNDAASAAPMSEVKFTDEIENAKRVVKILKQQEKVDLIVCLSHSGLLTDKSKSEDEILAKKVPEINLIISGHTHTKLTEPIITGNTIIGSCGEFSKDLGVINISQDSSKLWKLDSYNLKAIDKSLPSDANISNTVENYKALVQKNYFDKFGMKYDEVLAQSDFNFQSVPDMIKNHREDTMGNLVSDAYIYAVKKAEGAAYEPVDVAFVPVGTIRGSFVKGDIKASDAFTASSLGIGADNIPGYPLVSAYLTGKELKTACEVDASISPLMENAQLYMAGLNFTFNPNRLIFNKVTDAYLQKPDGSVEKIDDKKLYRIVAGLYSAQMLSVVGKKSYGLLSVVPKTKDGKAVTDFESLIIKDTSGGNSNEIKEWYAIAEYLKSFDKVNGVPQIPKYYSETHGRKVVDNNHSFIALISHPNGIAIGLYAIAAVVICLLIFIVVRVAKIIKHKKRRNTDKNY